MIALKEWQVVCEALAARRQTVILRKGGIHEGRQGFSWAHEHFALFPTRFHAQRAGVLAEGWQVFGCEDLSEWTEGEVVPVRWECVVSKAVTLEEWSDVEALEPFHIWTRETVRERYLWEMKGMKGSSIHAAFVETRELAEPLELIYTKGKYGGCRSWLEI